STAVCPRPVSVVVSGSVAGDALGDMVSSPRTGAPRMENGITPSSKILVCQTVQRYFGSGLSRHVERWRLSSHVGSVRFTMHLGFASTEEAEHFGQGDGASDRRDDGNRYPPLNSGLG